jgi:hypothetical protein
VSRIGPLHFRATPSASQISAHDETPLFCSNEGRKLVEAEVLSAVRAHVESTGRMFPDWGEILDVLRGLGGGAS